jgi:hypothetical protein
MELHTIGIDLGKTVFHLVGLTLCGEVVVRKKFSRKQLLHSKQRLGSYELFQRSASREHAVWDKMMCGLSTRN